MAPLAFPLFEVPTVPNLDAFGNYPILQFGVVLIGFIVTVAGLLGWKRGERLGREAAANLPENPPVAELHFDGPIKGIFEDLRDIKAHQLLARLENKEDVAVMLSASRNAIIDKLAAVQADMRSCIADAVRDQNTQTENRVRDLANNMGEIHKRIDELMRTQATILERMTAKRARTR